MSHTGTDLGERCMFRLLQLPLSLLETLHWAHMRPWVKLHSHHSAPLPCPLLAALILTVNYSPTVGSAGCTGGTFTALRGNFSKRVVTAVALPPDDTGFTGTLSRLHVTGTCVGSRWEAVAGVAGVTALRLVVICLEEPK